MKKFILFCGFIGLGLANIYISYDIDAKYHYSWEEDDYYYAGSTTSPLDGALTLGYETNPKNKISFGLSYDVIGVEDSDGTVGKLLNVYLKYTSPINSSNSMFGTLGYNLPQEDFKDWDWDAGVSYSIGFVVSRNLSISYIINNISRSEIGYGDEEIALKRLTISYYL